MGSNLTDWSFHKKRPGHRFTQGRACKTQREDGVYKARSETPEETNPTDTFTSDFQPPGLRGYKFLFISHLLFGFCMAALANSSPL